jgi:hypothetical protein
MIPKASNTKEGLISKLTGQSRWSSALQASQTPMQTWPTNPPKLADRVHDKGTRLDHSHQSPAAEREPKQKHWPSTLHFSGKSMHLPLEKIDVLSCNRALAWKCWQDERGVVFAGILCYLSYCDRRWAAATSAAFEFNCMPGRERQRGYVGVRHNLSKTETRVNRWWRQTREVHATGDYCHSAYHIRRAIFRSTISPNFLRGKFPNLVSVPLLPGTILKMSHIASSFYLVKYLYKFKRKIIWLL